MTGLITLRKGGDLNHNVYGKRNKGRTSCKVMRYGRPVCELPVFISDMAVTLILVEKV